MTIDAFVFLFGLLVSAVLATGLVVFYLPAYVVQSRTDGVVLSPRMTRLVRVLGLADVDAAR